MNLAQFRIRVSAIIGLDTNSTGLELSLIDSWVNEAIIDFLMKTKAHKRLLTMTLTAGETEYTLDTDILSMEKLWASPADGSLDRMLQPVSAADLLRMRMSGTTDATGPSFYAIEGAHLLLLWPTPAASDTLEGIYVPRPTALSASAHNPSSTAYGGVPEEFHPVILDYALWKAADYDDDSSSQVGLQYNAQYEKGVAQARGILLRKTGVAMPRVQVGFRRHVPASPGVDRGY